MQISKAKQLDAMSVTLKTIILADIAEHEENVKAQLKAKSINSDMSLEVIKAMAVIDVLGELFYAWAKSTASKKDPAENIMLMARTELYANKTINHNIMKGLKPA